MASLLHALKVTGIAHLLNGLLQLFTRFVGFIPSHRLRWLIYRFVLRVKIHRTATIYGGAEIRFPWKLSIGPRSIVGHGAILDARSGLQIASDVNISTGVYIWTKDHDLSDAAFAMRGAPVVIESHAWLSCRSTILPGTRIGTGAVVAAGAVVTKDVEAYSIVGGIPAKHIGERPSPMNYKLSGRVPFI